MFMFLAETAAGTGTPASGGNWFFLIALILVVVVFYFLVIRPQKKQEKEQATMKNSLQVGDEITTIGGIVGCVVRVKDDIFTIVTSKERTRISFQRSALRSIDHRAGEPYDVAKDASVPAVAEKSETVEKPAFKKNKKQLAESTSDAKDASENTDGEAK